MGKQGGAGLWRMRVRGRIRGALAVCVLGGCLVQGAYAQPLITVAWRDKPPLYYREDGIDKGFLLERAKQIFSTAGLSVHYVYEPVKRIWANFQAGVPAFCSFGWYRLPERESIAQYSLPFYTDLPQAVAVSAAFARVATHPTLLALLSDPSLTLGLMDGVSYSKELDARIRVSANRIVRRTVSEASMLRMLNAGRVDFTFIDREDLHHLQAHEASFKNMVLLDYPDMPVGMTRHIVCSKDVSPQIMQSINEAIAALPVAHRMPDPPRPLAVTVLH